MKEKVICVCRICGNEFECTNPRQVLCSEDCRKVAKREWSRRYHHSHSALIQERKRERRAKEKREAEMKPDTIVGEGYAARQIAKTLAMAGKVRTEL